MHDSTTVGLTVNGRSITLHWPTAADLRTPVGKRGSVIGSCDFVTLMIFRVRRTSNLHLPVQRFLVRGTAAYFHADWVPYGVLEGKPTTQSPAPVRRLSKCFFGTTHTCAAWHDIPSFRLPSTGIAIESRDPIRIIQSVSALQFVFPDHSFSFISDQSTTLFSELEDSAQLWSIERTPLP